MDQVFLDLEADSLDPTVIWTCMVKLNGEPIREFRDGASFRYWLATLARGTEFYAHNGLQYDYPVLERLWEVSFAPFVKRDTYLLSQLYHPNREGGHSLEAWGQTCRFPKGDFTDFSQYTPEMADYCKQDVRLIPAILNHMVNTAEEFSEDAVELEHQVDAILRRQEAHGWLLDIPAAFDLLATLQERQTEVVTAVRERFKPKYREVRVCQPKRTKAGAWSKVSLGPYRDEPELIGGGPFTKVELVPFNLGSRQQIAEYLQGFGWKPKARTKPTKNHPKGQVIVSEDVLAGIQIPEAQLIAEYLMLQKRIAAVQSWIDAADDEGRVHGSVRGMGAVTFRMTHSGPNMAQVPASGAPYGKECRALWIVREGYKLVGCDADGLELRGLAHYMGDADYARAVAEGKKEDGTDAHTRNQLAAGLPTRDDAKTFIYAFLYGAGDAKIGSIVGKGGAAGKALKATFLDGLPALKELRKRVEREAKSGWLRGLDGRRVQVRSEHAALNTLLQSAGAIVMKRALVILDAAAQKAGLDYEFVGNIHDEFQAEVREDRAEQFGRLAAFSIKAAGVYYKMDCKLAGSYAIGDNWAQTH